MHNTTNLHCCFTGHAMAQRDVITTAAVVDSLYYKQLARNKNNDQNLKNIGSIKTKVYKFVYNSFKPDNLQTL